MKPILILLIFTLATHSSQNNCTEGVLSCATNQEPPEPLICDFLNDYVFDPISKQCIKNTIEGCEIANFATDEIACLSCQSGKLLNLETGKCVEILEHRRIPNCSRYHPDSQNCLFCQSSFILENGKCVLLGDSRVQNCLIHESESSCLHCKNDFYLDNDDCVSVSDIQNCRVFTKFQCSSCQKNFLMQKGANTRDSLTEQLTKISQIHSNPTGAFLTTTENSESVCIQTLLPNCSKFDTPETCSQCDVGFYLTELGTCSRFPEQPIENCGEYSLASVCIKCANGSYMVNSSKCEKSTAVENCSVYSNVLDKCEQCFHNFWLDGGLQKCTERVHLKISECEGLDLVKDACSECKFGFSPTQDGLACLANIPFCQTQISGLSESVESHKCEKCDPKYYLTNNECKLQMINNCSEYVNNENKCQSCKPGFFHFPDRSVCAAQSIAYCDQYNQNSTNTCAKCRSLKFVHSSGVSCQNIDHFQNCLVSDGLVNRCSECLPGFFLQNGLCSGQRSFEVFDKHCLSNVDTSLTSSCTRCKAHFSRLTGTFPSVQKSYFSLNPTCLRIHPLTGQCDQCTDFHQLNGGICQAVSNTSDLVCKRIIFGRNQQLKDNFHCEACVNSSIQFLDASRCLSRSKFSNFSGCALSPLESDLDCFGCNSDLYTVPINQFPQCVSSQMNKFLWPVKINNCLIRDGRSACFLCQPGSILSSDRSMCVSLDAQNNATFWNGFDHKMEPIGSIQSKDALVENCAFYVQVDPENLACSKCKTGFVGIISQRSSSRTSNLNISHTINDIQDSLDFWNTFDECYDHTLDLRVSSSTGHVNPGDCEFGFRIDDFEGFGCLQCSGNKIGQILEVLYDIHGIYLLTKYQVIGNCVSTTIKSELTGVSFPNRSNLSHLQWNMLMPFTNCATWGYTDNEVLVYMHVTDFLSPFIDLKSFDDEFYTASTPISQAYCFPTARVQNQISNCQIYSLNSHPSNFNHNTSIITNPNCLACKPGFYTQFDSNNQFITSCSAISDCSTTNHNSNTWLNACESPSHAAWEVETISGTQVVAFDKPVTSAQAISNCEVIDTSSAASRCVMCRSGYSVHQNQCVALQTGPFLCENVGMGLTDVSTVLVAVPSLHFSSFALLRFASKNSAFLNFVHALCNSCPSDQFLFIDSQNASSKLCGKSVFVPASDHLASNCSFSAFNLPLKCAQCSQSFLQVSASLECVPQASFPNCASVEKVSLTNTCTSCQKGFYLSTQNLCLPTNCEEFASANPQNCAVCKSGFKIDPSSLLRCLPDTSGSSTCLLHSPTLNHCVRCSNSGHLVHVFVRKGSPDVIEGFECVEFALEGNGFEDYNLDYPFIRIEVSSDQTIQVMLQRVETEDQMKRNFSQKTPSTNPATSHCLSARNVPMCRDSFLLSNVYCLRCQDHYYLQLSNNQCVPGSITSCQEYQPNGLKCEKCVQSHFVSTDQLSCVPRTNNVHCAVLSPNSDKCIECNPGYRLDLSSYSCGEYSAKFCKTFHPNLNECLTCQEGTWKEVISSLVQCKSYSAANCSTFDPLRDQCTKCNNNGFPVTLPNEGLQCKDRTIKHCEQVDPAHDDCLLCAHGTYYNTGAQTCLTHRTLNNCAQYSRVSPDCEKCDSGYYYNKTHQECLQFPDGIAGCVHYSAKNVCTKCDSQHYLDSGKCVTVENPIEGCLGYAGAQVCGECENGRVLVENQCKTTSLTNCVDFENELLCRICAENFILDPTNKTCANSNILNCKIAQKGDPNTCTECQRGYLLSPDNTSCNFPKVDIRNCLDYESEVKCKTCRDGFILSENGFKCDVLGQQAGANCLVAETLASPFCDQCQLGHEKNAEAKCVALKVENCWVWNYKSDACDLCASGSFMDDQGKCVVPIRVTSSPNESFRMRWRGIGLLAILVIVLDIF